MEVYMHVLQKSLGVWWTEIIFLCEATDSFQSREKKQTFFPFFEGDCWKLKLGACWPTLCDSFGKSLLLRGSLL